MEENNNGMKKVIIVIAVFVAIFVALTFINKTFMNKGDKILSQYDYIIEKETEYSNNEDIGKLPYINLKGSAIQEINNEIMEKYYAVAYDNDTFFSFNYTVHHNILSVTINIVNPDSSEYGKVEFLTYNIDIKKSKVLTNQELLSKLDLTEQDVMDALDSHYRSFYDSDDLKTTMSYQAYKEMLLSNDDENKIYISDSSLYVYREIKLTYSLVNSNHNLYQTLIKKLD